VIKDFMPVSCDVKLYIMIGFVGITFADLMDQVERHFGGSIDFNDIRIESELIHTRCITYDRYDPCDYDNYNHQVR
jgi:hypothetical protein